MSERTIFLTGASGVIGSALLECLGHHRVVCLAHRHIPKYGTDAVRGDLALPGLGLDTLTLKRLAGEVDIVIHCAAITDFDAGAQATHDLNVTGTRVMLEFARRAGAIFHHVSTAFVARAGLGRDDVGEATAVPADYVASKRTAEQLVRDSGVPGTIIRPSVLIGDSRTGAIARFQGLHNLVAAILKNALPLVPLLPTARIDFIPQDVVARAVTALVDNDVVSGEYWLTAGEEALTARQVVDLVIAVGTRLGLVVNSPRLVGSDVVDRLIRPVFVDLLPHAARRRFDDLVAVTALVADTTTFSSTVDGIPGCTGVDSAHLTMALANSIEYLVRAKGLIGSGEAAA